MNIASHEELVFTGEEQAILSQLAVTSIEHGLEQGARLSDADVSVPPQSALHAVCGAFVTLTMHAELRGCIGNIVGQTPLYTTVSRMAYAAAFEDPRFSPLRQDEWAAVRMEISVLSVLARCPDTDLIEVGRHGLVLAFGGRSGVFLPQVAVEQQWDRPTYLEALCAKAGLPSGSWRKEGAELYWFEAFVFSAR